MLSMVEKKLAGLPVAVQMQLPDGARVGAISPKMKLVVKDKGTLVNFATGQAGSLGKTTLRGGSRSRAPCVT